MFVVYDTATGRIYSLARGFEPTLAAGQSVVERDLNGGVMAMQKINVADPEGALIDLATFTGIPTTGSGVVSFSVPVGTQVFIGSPADDSSFAIVNDGTVSFDTTGQPGDWRVKLTHPDRQPYTGIIHV